MALKVHSPFDDPYDVDSGYLTVFGTSHMSDNAGLSSPDYGLAHKICGFLSPATYRNAALTGSRHSWHNQGNGAGGDGGWAHLAQEFPRQEQIAYKTQTTITSTQNAGVTSYPVALRDNAQPGQWVVLGTGASTELVQIALSYAPATGAGSLTFRTPTAHAHTSGDPIYHACRNEGYLAKDSLILGGTGTADLADLGPFASGTFGTTIGASRGLGPFQHALRFTLAHFRSSVIYPCNHVSVGGSGFTNNNAVSAASYPLVFGFGNPNSFWYASATVNGSTRVFSTAPDFPGGTVPLFFAAGTGGQGALWTIGVTGATTQSGLTHDNRNANAVTMNDAAPLATSHTTGTCHRVTGLNPGVNTITVTATTINTTAFFLGWGVEAPVPPMIGMLLDPRFISYASLAALPYGYAERTMAGARTASVAAGAGTAASAVTLGSAATVGVAGTVAPASLQVNDTITIGGPAFIGRLASQNSGIGPSSLTTPASSVAVPTGNTVIVAVGMNANVTPTSVTDTKGNTYALDKIVQDAATPFAGSLAIYSAPVTVALTTADTFTVNFGTAVGACFMWVDAFSGVLSASRVDVTGSDKVATGTGAMGTGSSLPASTTGDLAYAAFLFSNNPTFTAGTGWVAPGTVNVTLNIGGAGQYNLNGSRASEPVVAPASNAQTSSYFAALVAYKQVNRYETRRITAIADSTHVSVDANFVNAHTGEPVQLGYQDADMVGGGYANTADTQGATSVPGVGAKVKSVIAEFDSMVRWIDLDPFINGGPGSLVVNSSAYGPDGIHYGDFGSGSIAGGVAKFIRSLPWTLDQITLPTIPNRRTYLGVYGDAGATPATGQTPFFLNSWTNYWPTSSVFPKVGYFKDMRTREVFLRGCVTGGAVSTVMFSLPIGYASDAPIIIPCWGSAGPAVIIVNTDHTVVMDSMSGLATGGGYVWFNWSWPAATSLV